MSNTAAGQIAPGWILTGALLLWALSFAICRQSVKFKPNLKDPQTEKLELGWMHLLGQEVKTVFVQPEASSPGDISMETRKGIAIIAVEGQSGLDLAENVLGV